MRRRGARATRHGDGGAAGEPAPCSAASDCTSGFCVDGVCCDIQDCSADSRRRLQPAEQRRHLHARARRQHACKRPPRLRPRREVDLHARRHLRRRRRVPPVARRYRLWSEQLRLDDQHVHRTVDLRRQGRLRRRATADVRPLSLQGRNQLLSLVHDDDRPVLGNEHVHEQFVRPQGQRQPCTGNTECASGFCVDGYCCNSLCDGQCQACNLGGSLNGACNTVGSGQPHGSRPACAGSTVPNNPCAGQCDGAFPASVTTRRRHVAHKRVTTRPMSNSPPTAMVLAAAQRCRRCPAARTFVLDPRA